MGKGQSGPGSQPGRRGGKRYQPSRGVSGPGRGPGKGTNYPGGGKGSSHKSSSATRRQALAAVTGFIVFPSLVIVGVASFFLHGYGVI